MGYIKSHSNYVLKTRHQLVNDGVVNERDITTIGGLNQFAKGQTPIYKSGNFIITVNDDNTTTRTVENGKWVSNSDGEIWTLNNVKNIVDNSHVDSSPENMIVLKQDFYDLREFAYYGSCSELIRTSLIDILKRFPGELFAPSRKGYTNDEAPIVGIKVNYYDENVQNDGSPLQLKLGEKLAVNYNNQVEYDLEILDTDPNSPEYNKTYHTNSFSRTRLTEYDYNDNGEPNTQEFIDAKCEYKEIIGATPLYDGEGLFLLDNPFNINIHSTFISNEEIKNPLKYFCNGGASNYELVIGDYNSTKEIDSVVSEVTEESIIGACHGDKLGDVIITFEGGIKLIVQVYLGNNDEIYYMLDKENFLLMAENDYHICPKKEWFNKFYNECDSFEKILINPNSTPKYTASFQIIKENDFGYYTEVESFTFPTTYGGYNIIGMTSLYDDYTSRLADIAAFYDERFCDNLYRSMTHEAIKNFDWTNSSDADDNEDRNGNKLSKVLRIISREFDEIKSYIDSIHNINSVTYDQISNIPDYFLSDVLELDGWDVNTIKPFKLSEYEIKNGKRTLLKSSTNNESAEKFNRTTNNLPIERVFSRDDNFLVNPYGSYKNSSKNGYALICTKDGWVRDCKNPNNIHRDNFIRDYRDDRKYSMNELNNEFMRRLKINSKHILRHKGSIQGVEMLLSLFGLRSKKWYDKTPSFDNGERCSGKTGRERMNSLVPYDYEIEEYTSFTHPIVEEWDDVNKMYKIDWYNSTKIIDYNHYNTNIHSTISSEYIPYQGLPVSYLDIEEEKGRKTFLKRGGGVTSNVKEAYINSDGKPVLKRKLYPYFSKNEPMDGDFYFQMNGGWLSSRIESFNSEPFSFLMDKDNNIYSNNTEGLKSYYETLRTIKSVNNIQELVNIHQDKLESGDVYYVKNISGNYAIINGYVNEVYSEKINEDEYHYVLFTINQGTIKVGDNTIRDYVITYNSQLQQISYNLYEMQDGETIKCYINTSVEDKEEFILLQGNVNNVVTFSLLQDNIVESSKLTNYFKLDLPENSRTITAYDKRNQAWSSGWRRLTTGDAEYFVLNAITDYFKGNNPHCGNMKYDCGHEYFKYFKNLFKYAYENNLFDDRCYRDGLNDIATNVYPIGFTGLVDSNDSVVNYDKYLFTDKKVHYFGNYLSPNGHYHIYTDDENVVNNNVKRHGTNLVESYALNQILNGERGTNDETYNRKKVTSNSYIGFDGDSVTNQIVNNKRLLIRFHLHSDWYTGEGLCEVKYLKDIVIPYMEQMIPAGTILEVVFSDNNLNKETLVIG